MNKYILFFSLLSLLAWSCGKDDDDLTPSGAEKNWLVLEDSDNPIDHLRYEIYTSTGVPIYYNDTVGHEERYSYGTGQNYTYYEVLQVFYTPGAETPGSLTARYSLPAGGRENPNMEAVLTFLRDEVLPEVPENTYLPSILLVDTLITPTGDTTAYKGLNTTVLGQISNFHKLSETEKDLVRGAFLSTAILSTLTLNEADWLEDEFYALSYAASPNYSSRIYSTDATDRYVYSAAMTHIGELGFIGCKRQPSTTSSGTALPDDPYHQSRWVQPTQAQDVRQYCQAILAYSEEEFMKTYAQDTIYTTNKTDSDYTNDSADEYVVSKEFTEFPIVKAKYYAMKAKLEEYGFTFE